MKRIMFFLFVLVFCFLSCDTEQDKQDKQDNPSGPSGSLDIMSQALYQTEVVNNTGSTVKVFGYGYFEKSEKNGIRIIYTSDDYNAIEGNTTEKVVYRWSAEQRRWNGIPSDILEPGELPKITTMEERISQFEPHMVSFFMKIGIDDAEYYLAGWPQSLELPPILKSYYGDFVLDTSKIVQYGIGYSDKKEMRVETEYVSLGNGLEEKSSWAYEPLIISIDNDDQTKNYDFGPHKVVYGKAVLTIDGPDKISFKTVGLALSPEEL